ncbi:hypothetical protein SRO_0263 [Streptomyces rochei]|nr:hypothetical protein SRO_0263 [Streptomyces rochei]
MGTLLHVAEEWGPDALPVLPVVLPLLKDTRYSLRVVDVLLAMGPGAASTASAVRDAVVLDHPGNHHRIAWAAWRIAGSDDGTALRLPGERCTTSRRRRTGRSSSCPTSAPPPRRTPDGCVRSWRTPNTGGDGGGRPVGDHRRSGYHPGGVGGRSHRRTPPLGGCGRDLVPDPHSARRYCSG